MEEASLGSSLLLSKTLNKRLEVNHSIHPIKAGTIASGLQAALSGVSADEARILIHHM